MKKLLMLLVAGTMAFSVCGCGKKSADADAKGAAGMPQDGAKALEATKQDAKAAAEEAKKTVEEAKKAVEK
jgi:hypothetical protein